MTLHPSYTEIAGTLIHVVQSAIKELRPRLVRSALTGQHGQSANKRHVDNFLSEHDLWMHERYRHLLSERLGSFIYASEEADPQVIGSERAPDLCILVDPLDTSELAVRGLNGYTHVLVYSASLRRPVVAVVGDIFHHFQLYVAHRDGEGQDHAFVISADNERYPLRAQSPQALAGAFVTNFFMKPRQRLLPLTQQRRLLDALTGNGVEGVGTSRLGVDFGSIGLCHVAAGFTDAFIEFAKGFALWDLAPGHYILSTAGGTVVTPTGDELPFDYGLDGMDNILAAMTRRQKFVAAGSSELAQELLEAVDWQGQ